MGLIKTGPGTLEVETIGLPPNKNVGVVLNAAGCAKASKPSNTLAAYGLLANAQGAGHMVVELENVLISSIKSVRLFQGNSQLDCGRVTGYSLSGQDRPTESLSLNFFNGNGIHFAIMVENDETHWVGHDVVSSREYEMVAAHSKCPNQPNAIILENAWISTVKGTVYGAKSQSVDPRDIRSFQVFNDSNDRIACGRAIRMEPI